MSPFSSAYSKAKSIKVWLSHVALQCVALRCNVLQCVGVCVAHMTWPTNVTGLCDMAHVYVRHELFVRSPSCCLRLVCRWLGNSKNGLDESCSAYEWVMSHDYFTNVTWLCDMAHLYVRHESCIYAPWLIQMKPFSPVQSKTTSKKMWVSHVAHMTWPFHRYDMTLRHGSLWMRYVAASLLICAWCMSYGVATVSRIDKIIGLFCRISSLL